MKKWLILLLVLFSASVVVPMISAEIVFVNNLGKYNIGDDVNVQGYVQPSQDNIGYFILELKCGDLSYPYPPLDNKPVNIKANERYSFDKFLSLPYGYEGTCNFKASFKSESQTSNTFEIVDDLKGDVFVNKKLFKLGEKLEITADILYLDNDKFNGLGTIYLTLTNTSVNNTYFYKNLEVSNGDITHTIALENIPTGTYTLYTEVIDGFENNKKFNINNIEVTDKLTGAASLDKEDYLPGEKVEIKGNVDADKYNLFVDFDEKSEEVAFEAKDFVHSLNIRNDIKSGYHDLDVKVTDVYGNHYEKSLRLNIIPVATKLEVKADSERKYLPEETVEITGSIYDQGSDLFNDIINVRIINSKNDELLNVDINSGDSYSFKLDKYLAPDTYSVIAKNIKFNDEYSSFTVDKVETISASYEDNRLKVVNDGNIAINDNIIVYLNDKSQTFSLNVKPSENRIYDLRPYIKEDRDYSLKVNFKGKDIDLGSQYILDDRPFTSKITGAVIGGGDIIVYLLILIVIVLILLLLIYRPGKRAQTFERESGYREAQERLKKIRNEKLDKKAGSSRRFPGRDISQDEARDFREQMLKKR